MGAYARESCKMADTPSMLWFSVTTVTGFVVEYEMPDSEQWLTSADWIHYRELAKMAAEHATVVECSDSSFFARQYQA